MLERKSNYYLYQFISQHRNAYIDMEQCEYHADYKLPNGNTRFKYSLDDISCDGANLQDSVAIVRNDQGIESMTKIFE